MDDILTAQFDRVEKALGTLVESIAAYNPSPQAALDLVAADDELSHGLEQLARHQANNSRLQSLRAEAEALEEQLKTSVSTLASLRQELFETPATTFVEGSRPVRFDELLQYAKNISTHTVPPTYRERVPPASAVKDKEKEDAASSAAPTNGLNTPAYVPDVADTSQAVPGESTEADNSGAPQEITAEEEEWLKKLKDSKIAWYPWPSDDKIRTGNLYKLMYWQAKNKDMDTFDVYATEEDMRAKGEAIEKLPEEAPPKPPSPEQPPVVAPRPAMAPAPARKIFNAYDDFE